MDWLSKSRENFPHIVSAFSLIESISIFLSSVAYEDLLKLKHCYLGHDEGDYLVSKT